MRARGGDGEIADHHQARVALERERAVAEHGGGVDGVTLEEIVGPGVGDALARAHEVALDLVAEGAEEVVDGPGGGFAIEHGRLFSSPGGSAPEPAAQLSMRSRALPRGLRAEKPASRSW